jgi:hypothetical protein
MTVLRRKYNSGRIRKGRQGSRFELQNPIVKISVPYLLALSFCALLPTGVRAQSAPAAAALNDLSPLFEGGQGILGLGTAGKRTSSGPSTPASEVLRGNGTALGYTLSHGNVLPETISLRVGGMPLRLDRDYWVDAANGSLYFAHAIKSYDSISVYYRYVEGKDAPQAAPGIPGLQLNLGSSLKVGLSVGTLAGDGSGLQTSLYGLSLGSKFGSGGQSTYSGLVYFSKSQLSGNLATPAQASPATSKAAQKAPLTAGVDHFISQRMALQSGGFRAHLDYQDVGKAFSGFQALRAGNAGNKAVLDSLTQMEGEKGVRRLGFGFGLAGNPKSAAPNGLTFDWSQLHDEKGSIDRQTIGYASRDFHLNYAARNVDAGFTRFQGLREAEKGQWEREKGMRATSLGLGLALGGAKKGQTRGAFDFGQQSFRDKSGSLERENLTFTTSRFDLAYVQRKTSAGFSRIADLADAEKNSLALDIRRQFDPDAKPEQVTQKERDQAVKEAGVSRTMLQARLHLHKSDALTLQQFSLTDMPSEKLPAAGNGLRRQALLFDGKTLRLSLLSQSIADHFSRLSDLSDFEHAQFANEHGLQRRQMGLLWQMNKTTKIGFSALRIGGTEDAIANSMAAAQKDKKDVATAQAGAASGLKRETLTLETRGFSLTANRANTDKGFARASDLALPDADRHSIETERGFQRSDYTAHFGLWKWLTLDSFLYNADNAKDKLGHDTYKHNLLLTPGKTTTLSYAADRDMTTADGKRNGLAHSLLTLKQLFGKGFLLNLYRDESATYAKGVETRGATTDFLRFETPKEKANALSFDTRRLVLKNDKFENTTNLNIHVKPMSQLTFAYSRQEIARGTDKADGENRDADKKDPSESTDSFDLEWKATKQFSVVAGLAQTETTDAKNADTVSIGLQGQPVKEVTLAAKFNEVHTHCKNTRDVADFSICNTRPFRFGPIRDLTVTARYASLNDQRKLQNETMTGRAAWKIWKNECVLDYGGFTKEDGASTISRLYSFTTDPNPKKWFHGGFLYKVKTLVDGQEKLIRRFTADWRLTKATNFVYTYGTLPEDDKGNTTPLTSADVALTHAFRNALTAKCYYRLSDNRATRVATSSLGFGFEGKLSHNSKFALAYSKDANGLADVIDHADHLHLLFDQQIGADQSLTLSAEIRTHDSRQLQDDIQTNLDFRTRY